MINQTMKVYAKIGSVKYNTALTITSAIKGTSQMKLYYKLDLESLKFRRWFRKLCLFLKIMKHGLPEYLFKLISQSNHQCNTRTNEDIKIFYSRTDVFKYSYFPATIVEWNKLDVTLRKSEFLPYFRNALLKIGRPTAKSIYNIHNPIGFKLLTRLRLDLSYLNEHKFTHNFQDCINPLCTCSLEIEFLCHFFLYCHYYTNIRSTLFCELQPVDVNIEKFSDNEIVDSLPYGSPRFDTDQNHKILSSCISFILKSERLDGSLLLEQME